MHLERKRGGGWRFFSQIEPYWPLPYSTMPVPLFRNARPADWVNWFIICGSIMPRAQNRVAKGSILKEDEILFQSGYIIYLWRWLTLHRVTDSKGREGKWELMETNSNPVMFKVWKTKGQKSFDLFRWIGAILLSFYYKYCATWLRWW